MRALRAVFIVAAAVVLAARPGLSDAGPSWVLDFEKIPPAAWWPSHGVSVAPSSKHATLGKASAKVIFGADGAPAWIIGEGLNEAGLPHDWRAFGELAFDMYNPQSSPERIIVQIKDAGGRLYKEDVVLQPQKGQAVRIRLSEAGPFIDLASIRHLNFFRWHPSGKAVFYIDAIRLLPGSSAGMLQPASSALQPAESSQWRLSWTSAAEKVFRDPSSFSASKRLPVSLALAAGEAESAQLVILGGSFPVNITAAAGLLRNAKGGELAPESIAIRTVGYVTTQKPYYPVTFVGDWPDPLLPTRVFAVPPGKLQPVWLTVKIPQTASAGDYTGMITLTDDRGRTEQVPLSVHVWNFSLPKTPHLKTAFDFYPQRLKKTYLETVPGGSVWQGRFAELERYFLEDMLDHRLMPMLHVNPLDEPAMEQVAHYRQEGLSAFSVGEYGGAFENHWPQDKAELAKLMQVYSDYAGKLKEQGLSEEAYVYVYDEPKLNDPRVSEVASALGKAASGLKRLVVLYDPPDPAAQAAWLKDADILCLRISGFDPDSARLWATRGKQMWLYTSSPAHPYPSLVIDSPAIAPRLLAWMCWKYQIKGLLYWCVNFWDGDPWKNPATFRADQNGNGFLYYPGINGPVGSIRLEALRDGLEDYEYLYRLKELTVQAEASDGADSALIAHARRLLSVDPQLVGSLREYAKDPDLLMENRRDIAETIEALQRFLKLSEETNR